MTERGTGEGTRWPPTPVYYPHLERLCMFVYSGRMRISKQASQVEAMKPWSESELDLY